MKRERLNNIGSFIMVMLGLIMTTAAANRPLHEEGTLILKSKRLELGSVVTVGGKKFEHRAQLSLVLVGAEGKMDLKKLVTDSVGGFTTEVKIPETLEPGSYRLVAYADDGDEAAGLDVELTASSGTEQIEGRAEQDAHPSAEPLTLERARSPMVTGGVWLAVILSILAGVVLLTGNRKA